jgi:hypothetical protein
MDEQAIARPATNPLVAIVRQKDKLKIFIVIFVLTALLAGLFGVQTTIGPNPSESEKSQVRESIVHRKRIVAHVLRPVWWPCIRCVQLSITTYICSFRRQPERWRQGDWCWEPVIIQKRWQGSFRAHSSRSRPIPRRRQDQPRLHPAALQRQRLSIITFTFGGSRHTIQRTDRWQCSVAISSSSVAVSCRGGQACRREQRQPQARGGQTQSTGPHPCQRAAQTAGSCWWWW